MESPSGPGLTLSLTLTRSRSRSHSLRSPTPSIPPPVPPLPQLAPQLPPWDRSFDAVYHKHTTPRSPALTWSANLDGFFAAHARERPCEGYFRLPDSVRRRIALHVSSSLLPVRPVRLNGRAFDRLVWRENDLQAFRRVFLPLTGYLAVSFAFRADILVTFLAESVFHATLSPFVTPELSPLVTSWLDIYGPFMQSIVLELDMTKLGFGPKAEAAELLTLEERIEELLLDFVDSQLRREECRPLGSLVLLCRRFHGRRDVPRPKSIAEARPGTPIPNEHPEGHGIADKATESSPRSSSSSGDHKEGESGDTLISPSSSSPTLRRNSAIKAPLSPDEDPPPEYCPDISLTICNQLLRLRDRIDSLRMCGFSESYTNRFIATLFPQARDRPELHSYRVAPSTVWPRLVGQKSLVDMGDGCLEIDDHDIPLLDGSASLYEGCIQLPPPVLDRHGRPSLPLVVESLHRTRSCYTLSSGRASSGTPSARTVSEGFASSPRSSVAISMASSSDRKGFKGFLNKYGRSKSTRRLLSRDVSATL